MGIKRILGQRIVDEEVELLVQFAWGEPRWIARTLLVKAGGNEVAMWVDEQLQRPALRTVFAFPEDCTTTAISATVAKGSRKGFLRKRAATMPAAAAAAAVVPESHSPPPLPPNPPRPIVLTNENDLFGARDGAMRILKRMQQQKK